MADHAARLMRERPGPAVPRLSMDGVWVWLALLLPLLGALIAPISTVDLAYHLRVGGMILDQHAIPTVDTLTFTAAGQPWMDQQWLAQVAFTLIFRLGGWALLAVVRAALVGVLAGLVLAACRAAGLPGRVAAWLALGSFAVCLVALGLRPQLLGMVLFAAVLAILTGRRSRPRLVWLIPILVVAWANVHGSFVLGPAAVVVAWLADAASRRPRSTRLLLLAIVTTLATLVNPAGFGVWTYAIELTANPAVRSLVTEWQPTSPLSYAGLAFYASLTGVVVAVLLAVRRRTAEDRAAAATGAAAVRAAATGDALVRVLPMLPTVAWLIGLAAIGAIAERGVAWWAVGAPVALAALWVGARAGLAGVRGGVAEIAGARTSRPPTVANTAIVGLLAIAIVALLPTWRATDPVYGPVGLLADAPRAVTDTVRAVAGPADRIWNAQRWGSWLEMVVPATPVAVDSRVELIPADAWQDHLALSRGDGTWQAILDRRKVTIVVAAAGEQAGLIPRLRASGEWRAAYDGPDGAVFVRSGAVTSP